MTDHEALEWIKNHFLPDGTTKQDLAMEVAIAAIEARMGINQDAVMDAASYLKERERMLLWNWTNFKNGPWRGEMSNLEINEPDKAVEMVSKWSEEHPEYTKTNGEKFEEMFPGQNKFCIPSEWWNAPYRGK